MFLALRKKCPYSELFWLVFPAFGDTNISPYSVRMRENTDQNKSEYGHFLGSIVDQNSSCEHKHTNMSRHQNDINMR